MMRVLSSAIVNEASKQDHSGVQQLSHATFKVWGWRAVACDILRRGRHFASGATFCVEGDIRSRMRHSKSGVGKLSPATSKVGSDITCRSQAEPSHPPRKHISLMTIDVILAVNCFPGERGK
jgi:hypothetical protein